MGDVVIASGLVEGFRDYMFDREGDREGFRDLIEEIRQDPETAESLADELAMYDSLSMWLTRMPMDEGESDIRNLFYWPLAFIVETLNNGTVQPGDISIYVDADREGCNAALAVMGSAVLYKLETDYWRMRPFTETSLEKWLQNIRDTIIKRLDWAKGLPPAPEG